MTSVSIDFRHVSDQKVLASVRAAVEHERTATAHLLAALMELDTRRLYLQEGCSSLFTSCTQVLHLSEHAAYNRIETARAARRFPLILDLVESGAVSLTAVRLLAPQLTEENHRDLLGRARHRSKRDIEILLAALRPQPDVPSTIRKLPTAAALQPLDDAAPNPSVAGGLDDGQGDFDAADAHRPPAAPAEMKPMSPERYRVQFTVNRETYDTLRRAQDLLRHAVPNGDVAVIFERALELLIVRLERTKFGSTKHPKVFRNESPASRHVPAAIKRAVWERDSGRCAFKGTLGRCTETGFLEYHHLVPFAAGGLTCVENLELRCRAHNRHEAEQWFGERQPSKHDAPAAPP